MYDQPLTIAQVLTRLEEQPESIAALTAYLPRARLHRPPGDGEWSVNDVLAHLRSCADMWGKYIAMIIAEDHPTIRAMNPTTWIKSTNYPVLEFAPSFRWSTRGGSLITNEPMRSTLRGSSAGDGVAIRTGPQRDEPSR